MRDADFWTLADKYEVNGIIPKENYDLLIYEVCQENNYNYDECIADAHLFKFKNNKTPAYVLKHIKMMCDFVNADR